MTPEQILARRVRDAVVEYHAETGRRPEIQPYWVEVSTVTKPNTYALDHVSVVSEESNRYEARA